ncbi:hypothetical protein [Macrococcus carouselicus]|uniref:Uncharacterized protein n=1 Tax=Macrococcus carouselicus TaxID=69969 RepID=A0A9Q8FQR0_9STAP|nr:hypothetical protein [Macrococcus carouselicus]TDM04057.1 hypothetical protein ERX40_02490 [Macrococcus carouselicus]
MNIKHLNGFTIPFLITAFVQALSYIVLTISFEVKAINSFAIFAIPLIVTYAADNLYSFLSFRFRLSNEIILKEQNDIKLINVLIILASIIYSFFNLGLDINFKKLFIILMWLMFGSFMYLQLITRFLNLVNSKSKEKADD